MMRGITKKALFYGVSLCRTPTDGRESGVRNPHLSPSNPVVITVFLSLMYPSPRV